MNDTIVALATPQGAGAISIIRLSGSDSIAIISKLLKSKNKIEEANGNSIIYGTIWYQNQILDEVLVSVFKNPKSYTGEDSIEISCHGSPYISQTILRLLLEHGARLAQHGEFTQRAFLNGKLDLSQAEAVADLIASQTAASHQIAIGQLRGGISNELDFLRQKLIDFTALIELELDFGEEDVEFADRKALFELLDIINEHTTQLIQSFKYGNAIKNGVPIAIIGKPNAGKSTLLNEILNENRALVSNIEGTTRDTIEEVINIDGILFRFIDTAGLRQTEDIVEHLGIQKTIEKIESAHIILYVYDSTTQDVAQIHTEMENWNLDLDKTIVIANKTELISENEKKSQIAQLKQQGIQQVLMLQAHEMPLEHKNNLTKALLDAFNQNKPQSDIIISNARHYEALSEAQKAILEVKNGLAIGLSGDLLSYHLKDALRNIGTITGAIDVDKDILGTIFGKFCIGK